MFIRRLLIFFFPHTPSFASASPALFAIARMRIQAIMKPTATPTRAQETIKKRRRVGGLAAGFVG